MKLTTENVETVLNTCLMSNMEGSIQPLAIHGVTSNFYFDPVKLDQEKSNIQQMLNQLPDHFFDEGWTFGEMFYNRDGDEWTGIIQPMENLLALGLAIGKISFTVPRNLWWSLAGGMPCVKLAAS